jgi:outer membrane protein assembly factor BamD (BamD/ComL family)
MPTNDLAISIRVVEPDEAARLAAESWEALPDRSDHRLLDMFISRFPNSEEAMLAFSLRHLLLQAAPTVSQYHRFIFLYRDRAASEQAIYELFDLLREFDDLSSYLDFVKKYPESPLARMAELRIHALAFAVVCDSDIVEDYDGFLEAFPAAAQATTVMYLATQKLTALAKKSRESETTLTPEQQANEVINEWTVQFHSFVDLFDLPEDPTISEDTISQKLDLADPERDKGLKLVMRHRLERLVAVLRDVYKETDAVRDFNLHSVDQRYLGKLIEKLGDIENILEKNHDEMVALLKREFSETRSTLLDGFKQLAAGIANVETAVEDGIELVGVKLDRLHQDLRQVHFDLRLIHTNLTDISFGIQETNQKLNQLDAGIRGVRDQLQSLNSNVSNGLKKLSGQVKGLREEVIQGFNRAERASDKIPTGSDDAFGKSINQARAGFTRIRNTGRSVGRSVRKAAQRSNERIEVVAKRQTSNLGKTLFRASDMIGGRIVAFDMITEGQLTLNLATGAYYADIVIPGGGKLDTQQIENAKTPELDYKETIRTAQRAAAFKIIVTNDYEQQRAKCIADAGQALVYFSSERFVKWACPETIASYVAKLIATQGSTWKDIVKSIVNQLLLEYNDIVAWFTHAGTQAINTLAEAVVEALLFQTAPQIQSQNITFKWVDVTYTYRLESRRGTELAGKVLGAVQGYTSHLREEMGGDSLNQVVPELFQLLDGSKTEVKVPHKALVIIWSGIQDRSAWLKEMANKFSEQKLGIDIDAPGRILEDFDTGVVFKEVARRVSFNLPQNLEKLDRSPVLQSLVDTSFRDKLVDLFGLSEADLLSMFVTGQQHIDLQGTPAAARLQTLFEKLTVGNEPSVDIQKLEFDISTYQLMMVVRSRHRHIWDLDNADENARKYISRLRLS